MSRPYRTTGSPRADHSALVGQDAPVRWRRGDEPRWRLAAWFAALAAVAVGAGALALHVVGTPWQYVIVLAALAHYLMWAAPRGLVLALALRRWWTGGVAAVVTIAVVAVQLPATIGA